MATMLSEHFSLDEMIESQTATRHGIDNMPPPEIIENLRSTCEQAETIRALLAQPMTISSGYRCEEVNELLGGAKNSAHKGGWAMDFICPAFGSPLEICRAVEGAKIKVDQCIQEGTWVHVSFAPTYRQEFLTAKFDAEGKASYSNGLNA